MAAELMMTSSNVSVFTWVTYYRKSELLYKSGNSKEKLRKKFIELCNEDTPMIRRACASKLG